jgi:Inner membrane protein YgaP-like, transmembrane domain
MQKNMGNADRIFRVLIAAVIAVLYFTNVITGTLAYVLLALGAIFLLTSLMGSCLLYIPFGINTCAKKDTNP